MQVAVNESEKQGSLAEEQSAPATQALGRASSMPITSSETRRAFVKAGDAEGLLTYLSGKIKGLKKEDKDAEPCVEISLNEINTILKKLYTYESGVVDDNSSTMENRLKASMQADPDLVDSGLSSFLMVMYTGQANRLRGKKKFKALSKLVILKKRAARKKSTSMIALQRQSSQDLAGVTQASAARATELQDALLRWDFDVHDVLEITKHPLVFVGSSLISINGLQTQFSMNKEKLGNYLKEVEKGYSPKNTYHNAVHAGDVAQTCHWFLTKGVGKKVDPDTTEITLAAIVAGLIHDLGHPGLNNPFLVDTQDPLALRYNDNSPLENYHAATGFELMAKKECNIAENLKKDDFKRFRKIAVTMVLGTDMAANHSRHEKGMSAIVKMEEGGVGEYNPTKIEEQLFLLEMLLHASDISNPAKPWHIYKVWCRAVIDEFFSVGDKQRELGLPVTPYLDRHKAPPEDKFQSGWISFAVMPLYKNMSKIKFLDISEPIKHLEENLQRWKDSIAAGAAKEKEKVEKDKKKE
eukprot:g3325.t1